MGFDQKIADSICAHIADGKSVRSWSRETGKLSLQQIYVWLRTNPSFAEQYARAVDDRADSLADELLEIADNPDLDPNDKRIRVDARKWAASKLRPKKYGDKLQTENDTKVEVTIRDLSIGPK